MDSLVPGARYRVRNQTCSEIIHTSSPIKTPLSLLISEILPRSDEQKMGSRYVRFCTDPPCKKKTRCIPSGADGQASFWTYGITNKMSNSWCLAKWGSSLSKRRSLAWSLPFMRYPADLLHCFLTTTTLLSEIKPLLHCSYAILQSHMLSMSTSES